MQTTERVAYNYSC